MAEMSGIRVLVQRALGVFALFLACLAPAQVMALACTLDNNPSPYIQNIVSNNAASSASYCELCGYGYVEYRISNPFQTADLTNVQVVVDLGSSGLVYEPLAPNPVTYSVNGGPAAAGTAPTGAGSVLTFNLPDVAPVNGNSAGTLTVTFAVRRVNTPESLVSANRNYVTNLFFVPNPQDFSCSGVTGNYSDSDSLPLREPVPVIRKRGWNYDAGQRRGSSTSTVYGNNNDDVVWEIRIRNNGLADLQDLRLDDLMDSGSLVISHACPSAGSANTIANNNGTGSATGCVSASNTLSNFIVTNPFGDMGTSWDGYEIDVNAGGRTSVFLVGKITATGSCTASRTNTVNDVQWGCEEQAGAGGITQPSTGGTPGDTATLTTLYNNQLQVTRRLTGVDGSQPLGSKGIMTIVVNNNSGGSVIFNHATADLRDTLPADYVVDPSYIPTVAVNSPYGAYDGRVDSITWTNSVGLPVNTSDPVTLLGNSTPEFNLWSTTVNANDGSQRDMLRHGDQMTIRFGVVLVNSNYYDRSANLDVTPEENTVAAQNTDPDPGQQILLDNTLEIRYETFCASQGVENLTLLGNGSGNPGTNGNIAADPEDLDIAIGGNVFILTNDPTQVLTLPVQVTNNGGHDATDHRVYATFGATMDVVGAPAGCSDISPLGGTPPQPSPWQLWINPPGNPIPLPNNATVYECTSPATVSPGQTVTYNFEVLKTSDAARLAIDDLTFRADVIGEITLSDTTPLWFPAPIVRADTLTDRANNYSLDTVWARVIGFNLRKSQIGECNENTPATFDANGFEEVQIGEECTFRIDTGGWFGFETPGFAYIAVQNIDVVDQIPDGQAYISSSDPYALSTALIGQNSDMSLNPGTLTALDETPFDWRFNVNPANRIEVADEWFVVNTTTRLLNKPIDNSAAPNVHAATSSNVLDSSFDAEFSNLNTGQVETIGLGPATIGYPNEPLRRVDLTVTEPDITVVKQVCNETLYGVGTACSNFVTLANDGDTEDSYIYRITLTNAASASGVTSAPAYNITSTDLLDASDMVAILPFATDGLDNDADGLIDAADIDGEGSISDNTVENAIPPIITFSHNHSSGLLKLDAGASLMFYYRTDPDDSVAPAQRLVNRVSATYDSLEGDYGNQTVVQSANGSLGGARQYTTAEAIATVEILPLITQPKTITALSNTALAAQPQPVSIGEEIEYELRAGIPIANLQDFYIRDELPSGIRCVDAPDVDLDAPPYSLAGFFPGGTISPTCNENEVYWYFGHQELTMAPDSTSRFDFYVRFIARVDNSAANNNGVTISNGTPATNARLHYLSDAGADVNLDFTQNNIIVREPVIVLTKSMEVATADSDDVLTVTVTAQNTGTATAYNLRVLDDLLGSNLTYLNNVGGTDPPDTVDVVSFGPNQPVFSWDPSNPDFAIAPGTTISFTFEVQVDVVVQPQEILDNTIQASWTSLPGQDTALNTISNMIGVDGAIDGMRIGVLPNAADAINDYETNASDLATVPPVTMTKTDLTPALAPEIGAHKSFQVEIYLPEGTTNNLSVNDGLDFSGLSYVLSHNPGFDVTYTFEGIASINGQVPDEAAFLAFPADNTTGTAIWNIGTVITDREDDTVGVPVIAPRIVITYYARINNDLDTDRTDVLQNSVDVSYNHGESGAPVILNDTTNPITVTEPNLTATKVVTPNTPVTGGTVLQYTITVINSGDATAYDVNITDTLSPELQFYSAVAPAATINTAPVTGFVTTPAGAPGGPLIWGRGNADETLDIPAGGTLELIYQVVVQTAQANGVVSNSVLLDWTSLDGSSSYERTGSGCPMITQPDDYCYGPVSTNNDILDTNALTKSLLNDTYADPPSTAVDGIVRVGDILTYRLSLDLQEGITRNVSVQDVLPNGLALYDIVSINGDSSADYSAPLSGVGSNFSYTDLSAGAFPVTGQTGTLAFTFGDVYNNPLGDVTTDTLVIEYRAQVLTDTLAHVPSIALNNTATLSYIDVGGNPVVDPARLSSSYAATLWQPIINSITKVDRSGRTSVATVNVATDIMNFRVEACNTTGLAPAYSVLIRDVLPTQMNQASIGGPNNGPGIPDVYINGALATQGVDYAYTAPLMRGGTMEFNLLTAVNAGQCVQIDYDMGFYTDFPANQTWNNSVTLDEYWSLPAASGQQYGPVGPAIFSMTNGMVSFDPPTKNVNSPVSGEATIGEEVVYYISVPGTVSNAAMYDVQVTDTLDPNLEYISVTEVSGNMIAIVDNSVAPALSFSIDQVPAGQQAILSVRARIVNSATANAGTGFTNTAAYTYAAIPSGPVVNGGSATSAPVQIIEPLITLNKTVSNITNPGSAPDAGDILRYTLSLTASGGNPGDNFSDAFDISIEDTLSLGLVYLTGTATVDGAGNTIIDPGLDAGDGINTVQGLSWNLTDATADIDVIEGSTVSVTYDVLVLEQVLSAQVLNNTATAQWTSLDDDSAYERNGTANPAVNDYFTTPVSVSVTVPYNTITKSRLTDTYGALDDNVRIGDIVEYEIRVNLHEGLSPAVTIMDSLPQGLVFEQLLSVNGDTTAPYSALAPLVHNDVAAPLVNIDLLTGITTVTWDFGNVYNPGDNDPNNNEIVIVYRARLQDNVFAHTATYNVINTANLLYDSAVGPENHNTTNTVILQQPVLTVAKTALPANGDTVLEVNELVTYTVDITNSGASPAYDTTLVDIIPVGLRNGAATITMISTTLVNSATVLPNLMPVYDPMTGIATWNFDNGIADAYSIPAGEILRIVYQVQAEPDLGAGMTLTNQAVAQRYYSFDNDDTPVLGGITGVAEIYGPSNTAGVTLTTAAATPLDKQNTVATATIGEPFVYRIIVPAIPLNTALHDVRILDDLTASAADLAYVNVSLIGPQTWVLENTGSATNLIIEDTTNGGIYIPAGEQIEIEITVVLTDSPINVAGLMFNNTATYTYNRVNDDVTTQANGMPDTTDNMTIVAPDSLTLEKTGPPQMRIGLPGTFTLDIHNAGTSTAWDVTVTDLIPNPVPGGMCETTPPYNISAQIYLADGMTAVGAPLVANTDFVTNLVTASPVCTFSFTGLTPQAAIPADYRLIISYDVQLDPDTLNNITLTNVAGVTQWFSGDTAGAGAPGRIRTYTRVLTDGTIGVLDHEDAYSVLTESPIIALRKTVTNVTSGQDPGVDATPGDTLRYRITAYNLSPVPAPNFSITDELDRLNASAMFVPGSINIITVPPDADISNTNQNGGVNASGLLDVRNLSLDVQGGLNDSVTIEFEATLAPVIDNATVVLNQAQLHIANLAAIPSDDPNINGNDNPNVLGDEDPTPITITSWPVFQVYKTSQDLSGLANELMAGDTLRYIITVKNIGTENAINTLVRDQIPANTTYVADSTTLNGITVADPAAGVSALQAGFMINAPGNLPNNTTPGYMPADASTSTINVATITFDVIINLNVANGTIISNQAYVNAEGPGSGPLAAEQPSDDPDTPIPDDPTLDVVGNLPLVDATKTVALQIDNGTPGFIDPGDVVRYTITISNYGAVPASGVLLGDAVPVNTTYVANTVTLNELPVGQPDLGVSPLIAGIAVSSSDLTPPLPQVGYLNPGQTAIVTFDVQVNNGVAPGTVISNQGYVYNNELPMEPTDADGNDANGDQPTLFVVGNAQQLAITKQVNVVGGGAATAGGQLEYVVTVTNIGLVPAGNVVITDNLDVPVAGQMTYVPGSGSLNGLAAGVNYAAPIISADYWNEYGYLQPGQTATLRFLVRLDNTLMMGTTVTNIARVDWNNATQFANASVSIDVGGTPGVANLNGRVWHDSNFDDVFDASERVLQGWSVQIYFRGVLLDTKLTDANGEYRISGLNPNYLSTNRYELRFLAPGAGANTARLGLASSLFVDDLHHISEIVVYPGNNLQNLNLPIDPNGVVYDSIVRTPIEGASLTLVQASSGNALPGNCFDDPVQQGQVTTANGYYKFDLNFSQPECVAGANFLIQVTAPADGYVNTLSMAIPPASSAATAAFSVPACLGSVQDAVAATAYCEVQSFETAPGTGIAARTAATDYHLHLSLDNNTVAESQLFNNHIAIDPKLGEAIAISKVSPLVNVSRGELVPYTITINNTMPVDMSNVTIFDRFPVGFKYVKGSARMDGRSFEPAINEQELSWTLNSISVDSKHTIQLLLVVGAGVKEGKYINRAQVISNLVSNVASEEATATVRVVPDPTFDCSDVIGKVFADNNLNGYQDKGEEGLARVRLVTATGLLITTDNHGRFHLSCAMTPDENRGSNFILKLDERTLPSGYRVTTENPRVQRMTRGKLNRFNFGATVHRVVSLDLANGVFEQNSVDVRPQWQSRFNLLIQQLGKGRSLLRLNYLADVESENLVQRRLESIKTRIQNLWNKINNYQLEMEVKIHWRHGGPAGERGID